MPIELELLLRHQGGVLSRTQAVTHGLSRRTVTRRVATGRWIELLPGVYLVDGHRLTDEARVRAAWLWGGERSTVHGPAAAFWLRLQDSAPRRVGLTVPAGTRRRLPDELDVRRRDLDRRDRVVLRDIAVTDVPLTALETAPQIGDGVAFLDRVLQRRTGFRELYDAYCRQLGRHGSARTRRLLVATADRADSVLERRLTAALRRAGIEGLVVGHPFRIWHVDLAFPDALLAVEIDSWAFHSDPDRFRNDRRKGNALVQAGWTVLRFTWSDITEYPDRTVAQIRSALLRSSA